MSALSKDVTHGRIECQSIELLDFRGVKNKEVKILLSKLQRDAVLVLLGEAESILDMKALSPEHKLRSAAYKAIRRIRNAVPTHSKD
jgi:hypothetical protein